MSTSKYHSLVGGMDEIRKEIRQGRQAAKLQAILNGVDQRKSPPG
jgi:hypothetical protein